MVKSFLQPRFGELDKKLTQIYITRVFDKLNLNVEQIGNGGPDQDPWRVLFQFQSPLLVLL